MTDNTDEFDQDQFDPMDAPSEASGNAYGEPQGFVDKWRNSPIIKLVVIMGVIGVALAGALGAFTDDKTEVVSKIASPPSISEPPGGAASPFFIEQNRMAVDKRVDDAMKAGGSALPTPTGHDVSDLAPPKQDPMLEFRVETDRLRKELQAEQAQNARKVDQLQRQMTQTSQAEPEDDSLAQAMQAQMQELMKSWAPKSAMVVQGVVEPTPVETDTGAENLQVASQDQAGQQQQSAPQPVTLVSAGTVNYMQLLMEANSDIPGPILAQVLSGPFAGGRAIGAFTVMNDYLVMTFTRISYKGQEYSIEALALDPDTTLSGMATEVDHRYFKRVVLPAAGSFISAFGQALSETDTETTVSDGTVVQDQAAKGLDEALYSGIGSIGETVSEFFKAEANQTKTLVRVAVGTPMGLFFVSEVTDQQAQQGTSSDVSPNQASLVQGYRNALGKDKEETAPTYTKESKTLNINTNRAPNF